MAARAAGHAAPGQRRRLTQARRVQHARQRPGASYTSFSSVSHCLYRRAVRRCVWKAGCESPSLEQRLVGKLVSLVCSVLVRFHAGEIASVILLLSCT